MRRKLYGTDDGGPGRRTRGRTPRGAANATPEVAAARRPTPHRPSPPRRSVPDATATQVHATTRRRSAGARARASASRVPVLSAACSPSHGLHPPHRDEDQARRLAGQGRPVRALQGAMLVNPGGPGGSGLGLAVLGEFVPTAPGALRLDRIRPPRGRQLPARAHLRRQRHGRPAPVLHPFKSTIYTQWINRSKDYANKCAKERVDPQAHAHVGDGRRHGVAAPGPRSAPDQPLRFSYGTYLGQMYASKYPNQVRRFVLDGVVDPRRVWYKANLDQNIAFEKSMRQFFNWWPTTTSYASARTARTSARRGTSCARSSTTTRRASSGRRSSPTSPLRGLLRLRLGLPRQVFAAAQEGNFSPAEQTYVEGNPNGPGPTTATPSTRRCSAPTPSGPRSGRRGVRTRGSSTSPRPSRTWGNTWFNAPCHGGRRIPAGPVHQRQQGPGDAPHRRDQRRGDALLRRHRGPSSLPEVGPHRGRRRQHPLGLAVRVACTDDKTPRT